MQCDYHHHEPARWACRDCQRNFCELCVPAPHHIGRGRYPKCTLCNQRLEYLGNAGNTHSLFAELPMTLLYPLQLPLLGFALFFSTLITLLYTFFSAIANPLGIMVPLIFFSAISLIELCSAIVKQRHTGTNTAPPLSSGIHFHNALPRIGQLLILFFIAISTAQLFEHSPSAGIAMAALVSLPLPACLLVFTRDGALLRALNPHTVYSVIIALGNQYWALWLCTTITLCTGIAFMWSSSSPFLYCLLLQYTAFSTSALLGYTLHSFQQQLHCQIPVDTPLELEPKEAFARARLLADNHILLSERHMDRARRLVRQAIDKMPDDLEVKMAYQNILIRLRDRTALENYAHHLTPVMLSNGDPKTCCRWFLQIRTLLADWRPRQPEHRQKLAQCLQSQNHRAMAEEMLAVKNPA